MGLSLEDFEGLTPLQFIQARANYIENEDDRQQIYWEITRWLAWRIAAPPKGANGMIGEKDFIVFPWEKGKEKKEDPKKRKDRAEYIRKKWS